MEYRLTPLLGASSGTRRELLSLHFGTPDSGVKTYIQAALHADELPGMLVAHHLRQRLELLESRGEIRGEVVLVPVANPIGLAQQVLGSKVGRFHLKSGENFNRHYPSVTGKVAAMVEGHLTDDAKVNKQLIRAAMRQTIADQVPVDELASMRKALLQLACDADIVLDLHCDNEAVIHLYAGTPLWGQIEPLAQLMGAQAVLLATDSGDDPFDEACARIWWELSERFGDRFPIPLACLSATIELRGELEVDHQLAQRDADAILKFLRLRGVLDGATPALPDLDCIATPLAGSMPLVATASGLLVFLSQVGEQVQAGARVAEIIDPFAGTVTPLISPVSGRMYARESKRYVTAGTRVAKIAGSEPVRIGRLLSS